VSGKQRVNVKPVASTQPVAFRVETCCEACGHVGHAVAFIAATAFVAEDVKRVIVPDIKLAEALK